VSDGSLPSSGDVEAREVSCGGGAVRSLTYHGA
jgi:hypothetical protein